MRKISSIICLILLLQPSFLSAKTLILKTSVIEKNDGNESLISGTEVLPGCSWYCGPGISTVKASSTLPNQGKNNYEAKCAHDFDARTAWVEGKSDNGEGEFLEYKFPLSDDLGVNELIIINGYRKTKKAWENNSRVKELKMYLNGKLYAKIELIDTLKIQSVKFPVIMFNKDRDTILKFEILSVYKGKKYKDTAITELLFDGVGVH